MRTSIGRTNSGSGFVYFGAIVSILFGVLPGVPSFAEPDASYAKAEREKIKSFIGTDIAKLIMGHYPAHTAKFHERQLERTASILKTEPGNLEAANDHAAALMYLGKLSEAEGVLIGLEKAQPGNYSTLANLGVLYKVAGQFEKGAGLMEKALEKRPRGHLAVGDYHLQAMKWLATLNKNPQAVSSSHFLDIPRSQRIQAEKDVDVQQLTHLILAQPTFADAYAVLGDVLVDEDKGALAALAYLRADKLSPNVAYRNRLETLFPADKELGFAKQVFAAYEEKAATFLEGYYQTEFVLLSQKAEASIDDVLATMEKMSAPKKAAASLSGTTP